MPLPEYKTGSRDIIELCRPSMEITSIPNLVGGRFRTPFLPSSSSLNRFSTANDDRLGSAFLVFQVSSIWSTSSSPFASTLRISRKNSGGLVFGGQRMPFRAKYDSAFIPSPTYASLPLESSVIKSNSSYIFAVGNWTLQTTIIFSSLAISLVIWMNIPAVAPSRPITIQGHRGTMTAN